MNCYFLKTLTILAKRSTLDVWMGPELGFAGRCNTVLKIKMKICPCQQVKITSF